MELDCPGGDLTADALLHEFSSILTVQLSLLEHFQSEFSTKFFNVIPILQFWNEMLVFGQIDVIQVVWHGI